jgi:hypothetical protein
MNQEITLYQIITGKVACDVFGDIVYVQSPTVEQKLFATQIYISALIESELQGVLTDKELYRALIRNQLWSLSSEQELKDGPNKIDNIKEEMYRTYAAFQTNTTERLRKALNVVRNTVQNLFQVRHSFDIYTSLGIASLARTHYLLTENTFDKAGKKVVDIDEIYLRILLEEYN